MGIVRNFFVDSPYRLPVLRPPFTETLASIENQASVPLGGIRRELRCPEAIQVLLNCLGGQDYRLCRPAASCHFIWDYAPMYSYKLHVIALTSR